MLFSVREEVLEQVFWKNSKATVEVKSTEQQSCKGCVHHNGNHTHWVVIYSIIRSHLLDRQQHDANSIKTRFPQLFLD